MTPAARRDRFHPQRFACPSPTCSAKVGQPCRSLGGQPCRSHKARLNLAQAAREAHEASQATAEGIPELVRCLKATRGQLKGGARVYARYLLAELDPSEGL